MILLVFTASIGLLSAISCLPQVTELPHYTKLSDQQIRHLQHRGFGPTVPTIFGGSSSAYDDEQDEGDEQEDTSVASTQVRVPVYSNDNYPVQNAIPVVQQRPQHRQQPQQQQQQQQQQVRRPSQQQYRPQFIDDTQELERKKQAEEDEEKEEPDRLTLLLPQSRFDCTSKNTGYYADEELGCEVFHYCQDNARHSWICPEGFTFHQVHLICMPPGADNICEKSSQFHFVNEYLYKPLNLEEHQNKPNISLRYSDRYYPENYYSNHYDDEDEVPHHRKQPIRVGFQNADQQTQQQVVVRRPTTPQYAPTIRPETTIGQVFRSPEEVNISLQQRRPQYVNQRYVNQNIDY